MRLAQGHTAEKASAPPGRSIERPVEAFELSIKMLDYTRTTDFLGLLDGFAAGTKPVMVADEGDVSGNNDLYVNHLLGPTWVRAANGMAQYVTPEMVRLVSGVADEMPPEPLFPTDVQFESGLIVLGTTMSYPVVDTESPTQARLHLPIRAIGYCPSPVPIRSSVGKDDERDGLSIILLIDGADAAETFGIDVLRGSILDRAPVILADHASWAFGHPWGVATEGDQIDSDHVTISISTVRRWLLAYFRLLWQEILDPEVTHVPRAFRRRFDRVAAHSRESGDVLRVIRLRKVYDEADFAPGDRAGEGSEHTHGHWRRAHWRRIHQGTDDERLVWVKGHWVRPDLPIIDNFQVVSVER